MIGIYCSSRHPFYFTWRVNKGNTDQNWLHSQKALQKVFCKLQASCRYKESVCFFCFSLLLFCFLKANALLSTLTMNSFKSIEFQRPTEEFNCPSSCKWRAITFQNNIKKINPSKVLVSLDVRNLITWSFAQLSHIHVIAFAVSQVAKFAMHFRSRLESP